MHAAASAPVLSMRSGAIDAAPNAFSAVLPVHQCDGNATNAPMRQQCNNASAAHCWVLQ
jgi:hypothetical protein